MKNLGERLRYARKQRGWSQEKLAQESGVNQGTISKIEREGQSKSVYAVELAQALGVDSLWLLTGEDSGYEADVNQQIKLSNEEQQIISMYRKLDEKNKKTIRDILNSLSS